MSAICLRVKKSSKSESEEDFLKKADKVTACHFNVKPRWRQRNGASVSLFSILIPFGCLKAQSGLQSYQISEITSRYNFTPSCS